MFPANENDFDYVNLGDLACSQAWSFAHRDNHKNVSNKSRHAYYSHGCCEEYGNSIRA